MHALTHTQRKIATEAHNIVYAYLRHRKLNIDDYYDVAVFGFLEAVQQYDESPELAARYSLSTIAYRKMDDEICKLSIYQNRKKRKAELYSLDAPIPGTDGLCIADTIPASMETGQAAEAKIVLTEVMAAGTPAQREAARVKAAGYSVKEAAEILGTTESGIYNRLYRFRARAAAAVAI